MAGRELYAPRESGHRRTWTAAAVILGVIFITLGQLLAVLPAMMSGWFNQDNQGDWPQLAYILFAAFGAAAAIVFLWVRFFERRGLATIGLNGQAAGRFLRGYGMGMAFLIATVGVIWAFGGYRIEANGVFASGALNPMLLLPLVVLLLGFIVQGSTEEIVFRGWLMGLIASRHGLIWAIIGNSLLFGLVHGGNIAPSRELAIGLINIILFGVFISLSAAREGSLWGVCGWHAAWNWLLGVGFGLEVSGQRVAIEPLITDLTTTVGSAWWLTGGAFGPEASVVTTVILTGASALIWFKGGFANHAAPQAASTTQTETSTLPSD